VQTTGCLNCHALDLENRFTAPSFADLGPPAWNRNWHATGPGRFRLTDLNRSAVRAFVATDRLALRQSVPAEFAARHVERLGCLNCHGAAEAVPALPLFGGKLTPEWMQALLAGDVAYKPRPLLEARMPAFPSYAEGLARGFAAQHGYPPETPTLPPVDENAAEAGRQMLGEASCDTCHAVNGAGGAPSAALAGIDFAHVAERLQYAYFDRWMRHPQRVDPKTPMPAFFSGNSSPFPDHLDGDVNEQLRAIWEYLRLGSDLPPLR
jgi:mono/diheme cytochrome c family protein